MDTYKLPALDLSGAADVEEAAKLIFNESSDHLRVNFDRFRENGHEAALMQIRIGMRRTRVALRLFKEIMPIEVRKNFVREFKHFGKVLGEARDMDVFLRGMLDGECPIAGMQGDYEQLRGLAKLMRDTEYKKVHAEMLEGRFGKLLCEFEEWRGKINSEDLDEMLRNHLRSELGAFALSAIAAGKRELLNKGAAIETCSTKELHKIRKYVKRARYYLRFFSSLFETSKIEEGYKILVQMQNDLGHVNDVKDGLRLTAELCAEVPASRISNSLRLCGALIDQAGHEVEIRIGSYLAAWELYEDFTVTKADLR